MSNEESTTTPVNTGTLPPVPESTQDKKSPTYGDPAKLKFLSDITIGLVFVLFIGFAGMFVATAAMLWDSWKSKEGAFNILENKVDILIQNDKEKAEKETKKTEEEKTIRMNQLEQQLQDLKSKNPYLK